MPRTYKHPLFSKRHYEFFAELCAKESCITPTDLIEAFEADNSSFDAERFQQAIYKYQAKR